MRKAGTLTVLVVFFYVVVVLLSACGGGGFYKHGNLIQSERYTSGYHPYLPASDYDPLAPNQERISASLEEVLRAGPRLTAGDFRLVSVDREGRISGHPGDIISLVLRDDSMPNVEVRLKRPSERQLFLYLTYPSEKYTPTRITPREELSASKDIVFFSSTRMPGIIGLAVVSAEASFSALPSGQLVQLTFSLRPYSNRSVSAAPERDLNIVDDLSASISPDGTVLLSWREKHPGDYNNDGIADIADVAPIAENFFATAETMGNPGKFELLNGNGDERIDIAEIAILAENFLTEISGYNVYRTLLSSQGEDPDPRETERWERILREGAEPPDAPPTVVREFNQQDFRLPYSLIDAPEEPGFYAYFVRPFSKPEDNPNEGAISVVAKTTQPAGQSRLLLTVVNVEGRGDPPIFTLDETVILKVSIENAFSVFSSNVRFLYRGDVLELLQDDASKPVPSIDGYEQNLLYESAEPPPVGGDPLFLGLDVGDATSDGYADYRWAAMNVTKKKPAPPASGSGALGYFRFRVKAGGTEPVTTIQDAFRFPSSTVFIYLMGEEYGVFLPPPVYTDTETIAISSP